MTTKTTLSITDARKNIFKIIDNAQKPGVYYTITEKGRPKAVIMSAEEFESWLETMEVMHDFPDLKKDVEQAEQELARGEYVTLEDILAKEGFILADKGKNRYGASSNRAKKGAKRAK